MWQCPAQYLAAVVSEESDGRQLAVVGAVAVVAAVVVGHRLAGRLADHSSRKLLACKALHYQEARSSNIGY